MIMKIKVENLMNLNYENGVALLEKNGYYENGSGSPDGADARALKAGDRFFTDVYFVTEDEIGNEHTISFVQEWEKGESEEEDRLISERWEEV